MQCAASKSRKMVLKYSGDMSFIPTCVASYWALWLLEPWKLTDHEKMLWVLSYEDENKKHLYRIYRKSFIVMNIFLSTYLDKESNRMERSFESEYHLVQKIWNKNNPIRYKCLRVSRTQRGGIHVEFLGPFIIFPGIWPRRTETRLSLVGFGFSAPHYLRLAFRLNKSHTLTLGIINNIPPFKRVFWFGEIMVFSLAVDCYEEGVIDDIDARWLSFDHCCFFIGQHY